MRDTYETIDFTEEKQGAGGMSPHFSVGCLADIRWRRLRCVHALWYSLLGSAEPEKKYKWLKNYTNLAKICSLVQWMQFPSLDIPKEWVCGNKKDLLMERGFCSCFPKHLLLTLLVWETGPGSPSYVAAPMPCASFPDDNCSRVPAAAAGICFQPSHLLALLPPAPLHQQLADLCHFLLPLMWRVWGSLVFGYWKELIRSVNWTLFKINWQGIRKEDVIIKLSIRYQEECNEPVNEDSAHILI